MSRPPDTRCLVVIPAFNEESRIGAVLRQIDVELGFDVAVVDDGSRDGTAEVARAMGARLIRHPINLGYGAALQTGYKFALRNGYSILVQMDADGQHLASEVPALIAPIERDEADLVLGSRFRAAPSYRMSPLKKVGSGLFRLLARGAGLEVSDPTSGFQAMNRKVMELYSTDFYPTDFPDVDVLLTAHRSGLRLAETPVQMLEGERKSSLHSGLRPIYYVYRTVLAVWVASSVQRQ